MLINKYACIDNNITAELFYMTKQKTKSKAHC